MHAFPLDSRIAAAGNKLATVPVQAGNAVADLLSLTSYIIEERINAGKEKLLGEQISITKPR